MAATPRASSALVSRRSRETRGSSTGRKIRPL